MICTADDAGVRPLPLNRLEICPRPKVSDDTMIAVLRLSFSMALKRNPLKITSSMNPTQHMLTTKHIVSGIVKRSPMPVHRDADAITANGM